MFEKINIKSIIYSRKAKLIKKLVDFIGIFLILLNFLLVPINMEIYKQTIGLSSYDFFKWSIKYLSIFFGILYFISIFLNIKISKKDKIKNMTIGPVLLGVFFAGFSIVGFAPFINAKIGTIDMKTVEAKIIEKEEYETPKSGKNSSLTVSYNNEIFILGVSEEFYKKANIGTILNVNVYSGSLGIKFYKISTEQYIKKRE